MKLTRPAAVGVALAIAVLHASCVGGPELERAKEAAAEFHARYNSQDFAAIYSAADNEFRKSAPEADYLTYMSAVHRKLGLHRSSTPGGSNVLEGMGDTRVTLVVDSEFAEGHASERFVWRIADGKASLVGYTINSPQLVMK